MAIEITVPRLGWSMDEGKFAGWSRKDGDRFFPLGMKGAKKIQDFFVDQKVPLESRDLVPIVEASGRIVWVAGYRIDERAKVDAKTKKAVKLTLSKI